MSINQSENIPVSVIRYVYILRCIDGSIYTGCTTNLHDRLRRHGAGQINYTKSRLPIKLETYVAFSDKYKAYTFEKYLKSGSGRAFSKRHLY